MVNETILAIIIAFAISAALCPVVIPFLHRLKFGQQVRDDGPQSHLKKQGTPTTGGVFIILAILLASIIVLALAQRLTTEAFIILLTLLFYTFAGFQDDYIKIKGKGNDGLTARGKLLRQIAIAMLPILYLLMS